MTVPSIPNSNRLADYTAGAGQTAFTVPWIVIADSEVLASADIGMLINNVLIDPVNLSFVGNTISGLSGIWNGGTVTRSTPCVGGERVIIYSNRAPRRTGNFLEGKALPFSELDKLQDDIVVQLRDIDLRLRRAPLVSVKDFIDGVDPNTVTSTVTALAAAAASSAATASGAAATVGGGASLWQRPVKSIQTSPPGGPATGDRYLVAHSGTSGAFVGKEDNVAEWNGVIWIYSGAPQANQHLELGGITYRYSQEAYDIGLLWRPAYFNAGGARGYLEPTDEPCGLNSTSTDSRATCLGTTSIGAVNPVLHFQKARGSIGAPTIPKNGDYLGSIGYRHYDPTSGIFAGSSAAVEVNLTEDAVAGTFYAGCQYDVETTPKGGIRRKCTRVADAGHFVSFGTAGDIAQSFTAAGSGRWFYGPESSAGMGVQSDSNFAIFLNRNGTSGDLIPMRFQNVDIGGITIDGAAIHYNTVCDARLKRVVAAPKRRSVFDIARPRHFQWRSSGALDFGFLAQELYLARPGAVKVGSPDGVRPDDPGFTPWQVDNSKLVPDLWEETRRLRQRVRVLEISVCFIGVALLALALKVL